MTLSTYFDRLKKMDYLIRTRSTGKPAALAKKMGLSERQTYTCLNELRELGAPVTWSYADESYIYTEEGRLQIRFIPFFPGTGSKTNAMKHMSTFRRVSPHFALPS